VNSEHSLFFRANPELVIKPEQLKYFQYSAFSVYSLAGDPCNLG